MVEVKTQAEMNAAIKGDGGEIVVVEGNLCAEVSAGWWYFKVRLGAQRDRQGMGQRDRQGMGLGFRSRSRLCHCSPTSWCSLYATFDDGKS